MNDEIACALASAITQNRQSKLEYLNLMPDGSNPITLVGWSAFSRALCDPSSLDATMNSNHRLLRLGYTRHRLLLAGAPSSLSLYLNWNQRGMGKKTKVVQVHFIDNFDIEGFKEYPLALVPLILAWLVNGSVSDVSFSGIYNILRNNSSIICWGRVSGDNTGHPNELPVRAASELVDRLRLSLVDRKMGLLSI